MNIAYINNNNLYISVNIYLVINTSTGGFGNSTFLSILPGLKRAGSRISILFVAIIIFIVYVYSNPSSLIINSNLSTHVIIIIISIINLILYLI